MDDNDQYTEQETVRRREAALKRMLWTLERVASAM